jgi:hypothetical protein
MVKIQRRKCKKPYLGGKRVYVYERDLLEVPSRLRQTITPFFDEDFRVDAIPQGDCLTIIYKARKTNTANTPD